MFTFNTGFFDKGILIMSRRKIAIAYLKSSLAFDLVCALPTFLSIHLILH